ncbi:glycine cleavage system aminomethyltransferase GcvT [Pelagibacterales bacterium SAG-MED31]|nr:glycine cleavage system aminomethyltransferase GcvT [Pelagibacterales bacterium SAG-MED31]
MQIQRAETGDYLSDTALKYIFLNDFHREHGAKFVPFAGYEMPINYKKGIINEHLHVREKAGIFDVSHMGQILILANDKNISSLEIYIPLNIKKIPSNKCHYSFILNKKGGIVDDIMISKIIINNQENIYIVYNASRKKILNEIFKNICDNYSILNNRCLIAIQGPSSYSVLSSFLDLFKIENFLDIDIFQFDNTDIYISRSGYTGEDGFEISIPNDNSENFINQIFKNENTLLCGLGCRDSLRVEAGLSLYGNEINEDITPIQANLSWALDKKRLEDDNLNGSSILLQQLQETKNTIKIGIITLNKTMLRNNMTLHNSEKKEIGNITSGCFSPVLKKSIGMGYINKVTIRMDKLYVKVRGDFEEVIIDNIPFVKKNYKKGG